MKLIYVLLLVILSFFGFSKAVRKYMFWRDDGTCQECGRRFEDGWMLHCAHEDHNFNGGGAKEYQNPANGKLRCVDCHIAQHTRLMKASKTKSERDKNAQAIRKLRKLDRRNYNFYKKRKP